MHLNVISIFYIIESIDQIKIDDLPKKISIIYRNHSKKIDQIELIKIKALCRKNNFKFYISNNFKLALKLKLDGLYISAFNKSFKHNAYSFNNKFEIIGGAHNINEINLKKKQNVKKLLISPIFNTKNKKGLGVYNFKKLQDFSKSYIIALGGIKKSNLKYLKLLNIEGFASMSFFKKNKIL
jgi:thiamine-phosphate pyrophosphorylase